VVGGKGLPTRVKKGLQTFATFKSNCGSKKGFKKINFLTKSMKEIIYPVVLKKSKILPAELAEGVSIREITSQEREEFFGVKKVDYSLGEDCKYNIRHVVINSLEKSSQKGQYEVIINREMFYNIDQILASSHVVIISDNEEKDADEIIGKINLAFKLFQCTSTGGFLGFRTGGTYRFHYPISIGGPFDYLH